MNLAASVVVRRRATHQQLARHDFTTPGALVRWLGCVQAQDWTAARWAVGVRLPDGKTDDAGIQRALDDGALIRIHALRWTWQLVAPEDARWIVRLIRERLLARAARRHRQLGLDAPTLARASSTIAKALAEGPLTRAELTAALARRRISSEGQRLPHLLACAELEEIACSGPRRGKQPTWRLLDEVAPPSRVRARADALGELATRYFRSRGPATFDDFVWWSGLPVADARAAVEAAAPSLASESFDGAACWFDGSLSLARAAGTYLLPAFDEYLVAYRRRDAVLDPAHVKLVNAGGGLLGPCVVHDGRVVGTWRRVVTKSGVTIETSFFERAHSIDRACDRYVRFATS